MARNLHLNPRSFCPPRRLPSGILFRRASHANPFDRPKHSEDGAIVSVECSKPLPSPGTVRLSLPSLKTSVPGSPADVGPANPPNLAGLPLSAVIRTYLIAGLTSSPLLLGICLGFNHLLTSSSSALLSVERNPILRWLVRHTFYHQFCAGENGNEVRDTCQQIKGLGFDGVILEYGAEILSENRSDFKLGHDDEATLKALRSWKADLLTTIQTVGQGDFTALKWSGIGPHALALLRKNLPPTPAMREAISEICDLAAKRGVKLAPSAEHEVTNAGIDSWTLDLMRKYNKVDSVSSESGNYAEDQKALIYITYQTYLRGTPAKLAKHLQVAEKDGFVLGVKLVRGAYLSSEAREQIWTTKEETDAAYDGLAEAILTRRYNSVLKAPADITNEQITAGTSLVLATHNRHSASQVCRIVSEMHRRAVAGQGPAAPSLHLAQLYGMADEVSFELLEQIKQMTGPQPRLYKFVVWGKQADCLNYLTRRAEENADAASRTSETRAVMGRELLRRMTLV